VTQILKQSAINMLFKYAGDATLAVPEHTNI